MKAEITRDVISDLWPLYKAGEASPETRRLVEAYLAEDPDFDAALKESDRLRRAMPDVSLSQDAQFRLITLARDRTRIIAWLIAGAIGAVVFVILLSIGAVLFVLQMS